MGERPQNLLIAVDASAEMVARAREELAAEPRVNWIAKGYHAGLLEGAALVYSADQALNERVAEDAKGFGRLPKARQRLLYAVPDAEVGRKRRAGLLDGLASVLERCPCHGAVLDAPAPW